LNVKDIFSSELSGLAYYFGVLYSPVSTEKFLYTSNNKIGIKDFLENYNAINVKFDQLDNRSIELLKEIIITTTHKDLTYRKNPITDSINFSEYI
jgi:hypothetical protein